VLPRQHSSRGETDQAGLSASGQLCKIGAPYFKARPQIGIGEVNADALTQPD
jgi:hypothetical protein